MEKAGYKRIFVTSGENKVPFDEDGSFKKEFLEEIQEEVDKLNLEFSQHVSNYTGLSIDAIMGFEAKCFNADDALERGLVNKLMTNKQFAAYVADLHKGAMNA
jgi:ClpP class serine protease